MNAKELRIGNRVNVPEHNLLNGTVDGITPGGIVLFRELITYSTLDKLEPIPLTPEILEQCGFKKYKHKAGYALVSDEKSERCDEYTIGKLSIMDWGNGFVMSNSFSFDLRVELKYLHSLQNLYFALTGKELEINL